MAYPVTGGTGFVGRFLVERLLERGGDVYLLVRQGALGNLERLLPRWGPQAGRRVHPLVGDVEGTRNALAAAEAVGAGCFHHVSSIMAAGGYPGRFREDMFEEATGLDHA